MPDEFVPILSNELVNMAMGLGIVFSLLSCFFGYKLRKLWIALFGFLLGFIAGLAVVTVAMNGDTAIGIVTGAMIGLLCALLSYKIYQLGMFLWCAGSAFLACYQLISIEWIGTAVDIAVGLLVDILMLKFMRAITIATTAISGGLNAAQQILFLLSATSLAWVLPTSAALAALGAFVQLKTTKA